MKSRLMGLLSPAERRWPHPQHSLDEEPRFLFIITPPYSGSTALAQVLNSCRASAFLQNRAEGQWLVPGMCEDDRWNPDKQVDWQSVRAVWLKRVQMITGLVQDVRLIIEKSPPNMVRMEQLLKTFPNHALMAFNRDPFANCASILYRDYHPERYGEEERETVVRRLAGDWLFRSRWIKKRIDEWGVVNFTYEQFCRDPAACVGKLTGQLPELETVDVNKAIKVKDYRSQRISDQNARQIAKLTPRDVQCISDVLGSNPGLPAYFGYDVSVLSGSPAGS